MFLGCDPCCDQNSSAPCPDTPPVGWGNEWMFSESEWQGVGYTTGTIVSHSIPLTGFVTTQSSISAGSGNPTPGLVIDMQSTIDIEGVTGQLVVLNYVLFDESIWNGDCNSYLTYLYSCFSVKGQFRTWLSEEFEGESTRLPPGLGFVVNNGDDWWHLHRVNPTLDIDRSFWRTRSIFNQVSLPARKIVPGAVATPAEESTYGPYYGLHWGEGHKIGIGVLSQIFAYENPESVSYRGMDLRLSLDNLNIVPKYATNTDAECSVTKTDVEKIASLANAESNHEVLTLNGATMEFSTATEDEWPCDEVPPLKIRFSSPVGSPAGIAAVFLPGGTLSSYSDYQYLARSVHCIEWRDLRKAFKLVDPIDVQFYAHPAVRQNGEIYIGRYVTTPNVRPLNFKWSSATGSVSHLGASSYPTSNAAFPSVCSDLYDYGRAPIFGKLTGLTSTVDPSYGLTQRDMTQKPVVSWVDDYSTELGMLVVMQGAVGGTTDWDLGIRDVNTPLSTLSAIRCKTAKTITATVTGGSWAGSYQMVRPATSDPLYFYAYGGNRHLCGNVFPVGSSSVWVTTANGANPWTVQLRIPSSDTMQTWSFYPAMPWGGVESLNGVETQRHPYLTPAMAATAVTLEFDMTP